MASEPLICHINLAKDYRGGERQTELLIRELAGLGFPQRLVIRRGNPLGERLQDVDGLSIRGVASNPLMATVALKGADLVHAHDGRSVYSAWLANELFSIPYVLTRRVVNAKQSSAVRNRVYSKASRLFAVSQAAAIELRNGGHPVDVVTDAFAALPVDQDRVAEIRKRFSGKTLIGHVGALEVSKGQETLFQVARKAQDEHPDWLFVLLGDGKDREQFERQTEDLANVQFEGFVNNVGDYLRAFDLFVFPSRREAVGSTLMDAMNAGLAIVASRTGGIPELIREGHNGILLEPDDADGFQAAIEVLLEDADERERLERNNREDAQQYSAERMAGAYARVYRAIVVSR